MKIQLFLMGKHKPSFIKTGVEEFEKRLKAYCDIEIVILKDEKIHDNVHKILEKEADSILKSLPEDVFLIICDEIGKSFSSKDLAKHFQQMLDMGQGKIAIVVGSAHGLSPRVKEKADLMLSLSRLTMNHQIVRLVLLEQLYRVFTILRGTPYHK